MAKSVKPKLTEEASAYISECYTELRSFDTSKTDRERVYLNFNEAVDKNTYITRNYFLTIHCSFDCFVSLLSFDKWSAL